MAEWGRTTVGASSAAFLGRMVSGVFPGGTLNSIHVYMNSRTGGAATPRMGVYAGGASDTDPTGATLIEDFGNITGSAPGWLSSSSPTNPQVPAGRVWIWYSSEAGSNQVNFDSADVGDLSLSAAVLAAGAHLPLDPYPEVITEEVAAALSPNDSPYSVYLDYTPLDGATVVSIDQSSPQQIEIGGTVQLSATVTNGEGPTTWGSGNEAVATVDASGLVTGHSAGNATITATNNGVSDSITVDVVAAPAQPPTVTITNPAGNIAVTEGTTIVATATATDPVDGDLSASVEWTSSVDGALGTGASIQIVTAGWSAGNRTITATATNAAELDGSDDFVLTIGEAPEPPDPVARFDAARFAINAAGGIA